MTTTYLEAISSALRDEMRADKDVFLLDEDIARYGGAFKVTAGFLEEFGPERVIDTPIAESAIVGAAIGAALVGLKPVAEMQFADFIANGFNQIVNMAAKNHYRWGAPVPMVIRCPSGGTVRAGPFHSQNPEAWFTRVPGLKVVCPSTPADAYGLLLASIRDPNPVLYFEHKGLYRHEKQELGTKGASIPLGKARLEREGTDLSIITYGGTVRLARQVAKELENEVSVEIVDLRTLIPLDMETVSASVRKTGKALVLHEDTLTGGFGGEVAARIAEGDFEHLDAPVRRLASLDTPIPFAATLEDAFLPTADKIRTAVRSLAAY
ncbi:MAG: alpha-ketoacid dehydrogenase subunit beta [Planctomycetota bacterium]